MIKIAICDDEELFRSEMEKFVSVYGNESDTEIEIDTYESASQMVKEIHDSGKRYDILFTDIEMPGLDGMEAAMALREMGETAEICFVTSHGAYALNSYQVDAVGYIMKPIKIYRGKKGNRQGKDFYKLSQRCTKSKEALSGYKNKPQQCDNRSGESSLYRKTQKPEILMMAYMECYEA